MKCLLEPLDANHVLCEFEGLAFGLDGELAAQSNNIHGILFICTDHH